MEACVSASLMYKPYPEEVAVLRKESGVYSVRNTWEEG
jgi:hypothetical protein